MNKHLLPFNRTAEKGHSSHVILPCFHITQPKSRHRGQGTTQFQTFTEKMKMTGRRVWSMERDGREDSGTAVTNQAKARAVPRFIWSLNL